MEAARARVDRRSEPLQDVAAEEPIHDGHLRGDIDLHYVELKEYVTRLEAALAAGARE